MACRFVHDSIGSASASKIELGTHCVHSCSCAVYEGWSQVVVNHAIAKQGHNSAVTVHAQKAGCKEEGQPEFAAAAAAAAAERLK